jgi:hypothetical protein
VNLKGLNLKRLVRRGDDASGGGGADLADTISLLRRYVVQETVEPLRHLGRVLAIGLGAGAVFGLGGLFLTIGTLRLIQAESGRDFAGDWSFAPYALAALVGLGAAALFGALGLRGLRRDRAGRISKREEA